MRVTKGIVTDSDTKDLVGCKGCRHAVRHFWALSVSLHCASFSAGPVFCCLLIAYTIGWWRGSWGMGEGKEVFQGWDWFGSMGRRCGGEEARRERGRTSGVHLNHILMEGLVAQHGVLWSCTSSRTCHRINRPIAKYSGKSLLLPRRQQWLPEAHWTPQQPLWHCSTAAPAFWVSWDWAVRQLQQESWFFFSIIVHLKE